MAPSISARIFRLSSTSRRVEQQTPPKHTANRLRGCRPHAKVPLYPRASQYPSGNRPIQSQPHPIPLRRMPTDFSHIHLCLPILPLPFPSPFRDKQRQIEVERLKNINLLSIGGNNNTSPPAVPPGMSFAGVEC
eukprot:1349253-Amorphochlora_amoeboformis.AAC.1